MSEKVDFKKKVVMLVDDDNVDNFINKKVIINSKFTDNVYVHTTTDSALEFFKNMDELKLDLSSPVLPSHIFLDINMPVSDGFHFLEEFNKLPAKITDEVKIIMLTSSLNPNDQVKSEGYKNVIRFLSKPLTVDDLMNMN